MRHAQRSALEAEVLDDVEKAAKVADVLKAVAHPLRLRIVALLCKGERQVNAIADRLGVPQAIVSQQLRILRMHRLVTAVRVSGSATYRLLEPRLRQLVSCMEQCSLQ
jgi:DNA-binding transcriptional ArsR family regulator